MNSTQELKTLVDALRSLRNDTSQGAALATITRTQGSTFRRAGTRMLVISDGSVVCELSGGCPQRDIELRAQEAIASGGPRLVNYNAESSLDVLMEMGCGGELEVLVEPVSAPHATDFADALAQCLDERRSARMAMVFAIGGIVVPPQRLIWSAQETHFDTIGDPALAEAIRASAETIDVRHVVTLRLSSINGMADVLIEPVAPPHSVVVIGGNTAALALWPVLDLLGWQLTVVDQDPQRLRADRLPSAVHAVCASPATVRHALTLDAHTSVVVMTHNVEQDIAYLAALRDAPVAYIGALGSRERAERMRDDARFAGNQHLHAPAGLDIGSETPTEIAMAVVTEILAVINRHSGGPLHDRSGTIHG